MKRPTPITLAALAMLAFSIFLHLPSSRGTAQPAPDAAVVPGALYPPPPAGASELPYPGSWRSGIPIDARAEAQAAWGDEYAVNPEVVAIWDDWYGQQLAYDSRNGDPSAHYWRPRGWLDGMFAMSTANAQAAELPEAPAAGDASTLADSMYARWVIQHHIATALDQLVADGLTVTTQPDPAQTALLTQIEAHLKAIADKPAGGGLTDDQLNAIVSAVQRQTPTAAQWTQLLNAVGTVGDKPAGQLTPEQLKALTDAISGIGASIEALGDELEAVLGGSVAPPPPE